MDLGQMKYRSELNEYWHDHLNQIPWIPIPNNSNWMIKPMPPVGGALARFLVTIPELTGKSVSIYLDIDGSLGYEDGPYWEIYPAADGDTARCAKDDVYQLVHLIEGGLEVMRSKQDMEEKK